MSRSCFRVKVVRNIRIRWRKYDEKLYDYDVGENVSLFVLIKTSETRIAKNGNKFIAINFSDKSGVISAKFWDASAKDIEQFKAGNVVYLKESARTIKIIRRSRLLIFVWQKRMSQEIRVFMFRMHRRKLAK